MSKIKVWGKIIEPESRKGEDVLVWVDTVDIEKEILRRRVEAELNDRLSRQQRV